MPLAQGQVLNNRYRIAKLLGEHEFGAVYRAWDMNADGACAIEEIFDTSDSAQMAFARQSARLINLSPHPHLPRVFDAFIVPGQGMYLALDFIDGENLQAILDKSDGPLPQEQVLPWFSQVGEALNHLHSQNPPLIHNSVKPANIRIRGATSASPGQAVLVGLGAAILYDPYTQSLPGVAVANAGFSPPEAYSRTGLDARSDVYALGATFYTLLSGKRLAESMLIKGKDAPPARPLHEVNPQINPKLSAAIGRAIQMAPAERFGNVSEFEAAVLPGAQPEVVVSSKLAQRRSRWGWIVGGVILLFVLLAILLGGGWWAYNYIADRLATPTPLPPTTTMTATLTPTLTNTPLTPTATFTPSVTPSPTGLAERIVDPKGVTMLLVPVGPFAMGSYYGAVDERPVHTVNLGAFYIDLYEVTNAHYADCVKDGACSAPTKTSSATHPSYYSNPDFADYPVIYVNWAMAKAYCEWRGGRLPSEAEWEKAARGTDERTFPWGEEINCTFANIWGGSGCVGDVTKVGSYPTGASPYGLLDMTGNVWEWVMDWFNEGYYANSPADNPTGPDGGGYHVLRGGSWAGGPGQASTTTRGRNLPTGVYNYAGFRCVRLP